DNGKDELRSTKLRISLRKFNIYNFRYMRGWNSHKPSTKHDMINTGFSIPSLWET
ncbi:hypothetical protein KI387_024229, partial [Taxus chinensis]